MLRNFRNFEKTSVPSEKLWKNMVSFKLEVIIKTTEYFQGNFGKITIKSKNFV